MNRPQNHPTPNYWLEILNGLKKKEKKKRGYSLNVLLATHRGRFCLWVIDHASAVDNCTKIVYKQQKDKHLPLNFKNRGDPIELKYSFNMNIKDYHRGKILYCISYPIQNFPATLFH